MTEPAADTQTNLLDDLAQRRDWPALRDAADRIIAAGEAPWLVYYHAARARLELKEPQTAEPLLETGMTRFPSVPQLGVLYGLAGGQTLPAEAAAERWRDLHERLPDGPGLRLGYAHALRVIGRAAESEALLAEGARLRPDHLPTLIQYAEAASARGDFAETAQRYAAAHEQAPDRTDIQTAQIHALRQAGQLDEADSVARVAVAAHPTATDLLSAQAAVAAAREDWVTTASTLRRVVVRDAANQPAWEGLIWALARERDWAALEAAAAEGLRHHPGNAVLRIEYARAASAREDWPSSVSRWNAVAENCPPSAEAYFGRIDALIRARQMNAAEVVSAEAVGFAPDDRALLMQNAELAGLRLDAEEATKRWRALKRKFPDDPAIDEGLAATRKYLGNESQKVKREETVKKKIPVRGSIRIIEKPQGEAREPVSGPVAFDRLKAGLPDAPAPKPRRLWDKLFGK